jgi:hypothetical protein
VPPVTLQKPVKASPPGPVRDSLVRPVSLSTPVVRGQSAEPPKAMPSGPPTPPVVEDLPKPTKVSGDKGVVIETVPPGTYVLPYGTTLPPGTSLPPNIVIAQTPTTGPALVPQPVTNHGVMSPPGMPVPGGVPVTSGPMMGPVEGQMIGDPAMPMEVPFGMHGPGDGMMVSPGCGGGVCMGGPNYAVVEAESCCDEVIEGEECEGGCLYGNKRCWASAEYLLWWVKDSPSPATVNFNGQPVLGADDPSASVNSGVRLAAGLWFLEGQQFGGDLGFLYIGLGDKGNDLGDTGSHNMLIGGEANLRGRFLCGQNYRVEALGGFRYLGLYDSLLVSNLNGNTPTRINLEAANSFYGGQLGLRGVVTFGKFAIDLTGKCAIGTTVQSVERNGQPVTHQSSHGEKRHNSRFAVIPEATANIGYQVTDWWRVQIGYNFLYWNKVGRAADQQALIPGATAGPATKNYSDFWAQGINFGMEFRF